MRGHSDRVTPKGYTYKELSGALPPKCFNASKQKNAERGFAWCCKVKESQDIMTCPPLCIEDGSSLKFWLLTTESETVRV